MTGPGIVDIAVGVAVLVAAAVALAVRDRLTSVVTFILLGGLLAVWALDCALPHTHEVYDVLTYEGEGAGPGTSYPGVATVQDWSEQACFDRFEDFVGVRWTVSELDIAVWWPSEDSWARADRSVICTVMSDSGDQLVGTRRDSRA